MLEDGREASGAASAPPSSLGDRQQLTPARGSEPAPAPLRRSARRQRQQQQANLRLPHAVEVQRPSTLSPILRSPPPALDSSALSTALPAARLFAAQAKILAPPALEDQQRGALQQAFSAPSHSLAGTEPASTGLAPVPPAAEQALVSLFQGKSWLLIMAGRN